MEKTNNTAIRAQLIILGIMIVGLLLRLFGLRAESAWWDEYASLTFLDAPTLAAFLH